MDLRVADLVFWSGGVPYVAGDDLKLLSKLLLYVRFN
jgi:hypothetical protein